MLEKVLREPAGNGASLYDWPKNTKSMSFGKLYTPKSKEKNQRIILLFDLRNDFSSFQTPRIPIVSQVS